MKDKFWYLKNLDLFGQLPTDEITRIESRAKSRAFQRGQLVYLPLDSSDSVYLLTSGRIKIYHLTSEGKQALLTLIDPGELFGELAIFTAGQREEFAEAAENSTLVRIPGSEIQRLMESYPTVSLNVMRLMGLRRQQVERRLKSLLFRSNRERLVYLLVELAEKYGRFSSQGIVLDIKLSHQELANTIGSTRETVTVTLGELQTEGMLSIKRRQIILHKLDRLAMSVDLPAPIISEPSTTTDAKTRRTECDA